MLFLIYKFYNFYFYIMGNNHDKYFGKEKRKILVLGLPGSGKTCTKICNLALVEVIVQGK